MKQPHAAMSVGIDIQKKCAEDIHCLRNEVLHKAQEIQDESLKLCNVVDMLCNDVDKCLIDPKHSSLDASCGESVKMTAKSDEATIFFKVRKL